MLFRSLALSLALCPVVGAQNQLFFEGLLHTTLGQAQMAQTCHDCLVISNIGASGDDGVCVDLGECLGFSWTIGMDPSAMPLGASTESSFHGVLDGVPGSPMGSFSAVRSTNGFAVQPDFSGLGASTYAVEIYEGPDLVYSASGVVGAHVEIDPPSPLLPSCYWCVVREEAWYPNNIPVTYHTPTGTVLGDGLLFRPEGTTFSAAYLTDLEILGGGGASEMLLGRELVHTGGLPHGAMGLATFVPTDKGCCLTVSNIGSSGDDGVELHLDAVSAEARWAPLDPAGAAPAGASLEARMVGLSDSDLGAPLATTRVTKTAASFDIEVDVSPSGATTVELELLSGGSTVWTEAGMSGLVARVSSWPDGTAADRAPSSAWLWNAQVQVEIVGVGTFLGDELRLHAEGATVAIGPLSRLDLALADLAELELNAESETPPQPLGDVYCTPAVPNSTGQPARIRAIGSDAVAENDLHLTSEYLPSGEFGYYLASETQGFVANPGGSAGNLCVGGKIARLRSQIQSSGATGTIAIAVDLTNIPLSPPQAVLPGEIWNFQLWFRDGMTSNFTDGVSVLFH